VLTIIAFAALALYVALQTPSSRAQSSSLIAAIQANESEPVAVPRLVAAASANGTSPAVVASNIGIRTLAVSSKDDNASTLPDASATTELYLTAIDRPDRIFSFAFRNSPALLSATVGKILAVPFVGTGAIGSVGDGGAAPRSELDLSQNQFTMRSGVAVAPDGTFFIADTGNATIREVAGPASSEPGIIRSIAGRWAPRQNVELAEPMGIALDRAQNLYIADRGMNAILVLYGSASPKAGELAILAHMVSPASVGVSPDGTTLFASSADSGAVVVINTQTHALRSVAGAADSLFASALQHLEGSRNIPAGLAVDGGGNLFIAYSSPRASYDQILRLDALSSHWTVAARGLSGPGDISFDRQGDLFVANQGTRQVLEFKGMGDPATGVTLTPPAPCASGTTTFCDQLIGGTSSPLPFELSNNTASAITGITPSFTGGKTPDFTIASSSCASSLAAGASCALNIAFVPTANATSSCGAGFAPNSRCSTVSVDYNGATAPVTASVSGIADDFQVTCMSTSMFTCPPLSNGAPYQITIAQGAYGTFQLQIVPDHTFSGVVTLTCPTGLPVAPAGTIGSPTTCGISAGTSVTEPLVNTLALNVTPGTAVPFNVTFQTTTTAGTQTLPPTTTSTSTSERQRAALFSGAYNGGRGGPWLHSLRTSIAAHQVDRTGVLESLKIPTLLLAALVLVMLPLFHPRNSRPLGGLAPVFVLASFGALLAGCHHSSTKAKPVIPYTPMGTYTLTVQGSAQNASRGFTVTLVVD